MFCSWGPGTAGSLLSSLTSASDSPDASAPPAGCRQTQPCRATGTRRVGQKYMWNAIFVVVVVVVSILPLLRRTLTVTHRHQRDAATVADGDVHTCQLWRTAPVAWTHRGVTGERKHPSSSVFNKRWWNVCLGYQILVWLTCKAAVLEIPYPFLLILQEQMVNTASYST